MGLFKRGKPDKLQVKYPDDERPPLGEPPPPPPPPEIAEASKQIQQQYEPVPVKVTLEILFEGLQEIYAYLTKLDEAQEIIHHNVNTIYNMVKNEIPTKKKPGRPKK